MELTDEIVVEAISKFESDYQHFIDSHNVTELDNPALQDELVPLVGLLDLADSVRSVKENRYGSNRKELSWAEAAKRASNVPAQIINMERFSGDSLLSGDLTEREWLNRSAALEAMTPYVCNWALGRCHELVTSETAQAVSN